MKVTLILVAALVSSCYANATTGLPDPNTAPSNNGSSDNSFGSTLPPYNGDFTGSPPPHQNNDTFPHPPPNFCELIHQNCTLHNLIFRIANELGQELPRLVDMLAEDFHLDLSKNVSDFIAHLNENEIKSIDVNSPVIGALIKLHFIVEDFEHRFGWLAEDLFRSCPVSNYLFALLDHYQILPPEIKALTQNFTHVNIFDMYSCGSRYLWNGTSATLSWKNALGRDEFLSVLPAAEFLHDLFQFNNGSVSGIINGFRSQCLRAEDYQEFFEDFTRIETTMRPDNGTKLFSSPMPITSPKLSTNKPTTKKGTNKATTKESTKKPTTRQTTKKPTTKRVTIKPKRV